MEINPLTIGTTFWFEERKHYEVMEHWRLELKLDYHLIKDIKRKRITKKELTKHDNY